jgi:hypothetical protein
MKNSQYVLWRPVPNGAKTDKIPVGPTGAAIDPLDPRNWMRRAEAEAAAQFTGFGLAFVFTAGDPYFFIDVDHALVDGRWSELSARLVRMFQGCAMEISQSGTGLHIFGRGSLPEAHRKRNTALGLELYTQKRFVALTGTQARGNADTDAQAALEAFYAEFLAPLEGFGGGSAEWTSEPVADWRGPEDDAELLKRARRSKSVASTFGGGASFAQLWDADADVLAGAYPGPKGFDPSSADAALLSHLAFWTGKNCERMERLFGQSALGQRDKWRDRDDYRERSILGAVAHCRNVYRGRDPIGVPQVSTPPTGAATPAPVPGPRMGEQWMDLAAQMEHFRGCAYVIGRHRVFVPGQGLLKPEQFKAAKGGYQFAIQHSGKPTRSAFEAFTESQLYHFPKVHGSCFRPELPPGGIVADEGLLYVNTYAPIQTDRRPGDAGPFLDLLGRLLPVRRDAEILLAYMAACVQYPGAKFQWAPLLQGVQGNGKTFMMQAVSRAVGVAYSHFPKASQIGNQFNSWVQGKLFAGIEEIRVNERMDLMEELKVLITNDRIAIEPKNVDQYLGDNRANFMLCSNHKDAVIKSASDRRYCVLYTAQQEAGHLTRDGLGGDYFPRLYAWARSGGFAVITDYLHGYAIPDELNPAGLCHRAPRTSSTDEAVGLSLGPIEQEVAEAVAEERWGFRGGWISSVALGNLLDKKGRKLALQKRAGMLEGMGYVIKERSSQASPQDDGKKPVLYVRAGSGLEWVPCGAATFEAYQAAQQG